MTDTSKIEVEVEKARMWLRSRKMYEGTIFGDILDAYESQHSTIQMLESNLRSAVKELEHVSESVKIKGHACLGDFKCDNCLLSGRIDSWLLGRRQMFGGEKNE